MKRLRELVREWVTGIKGGHSRKALEQEVESEAQLWVMNKHMSIDQMVNDRVYIRGCYSRRLRIPYAHFERTERLPTHHQRKLKTELKKAPFAYKLGSAPIVAGFES